jgi:hypothetical protein
MRLEGIERLAQASIPLGAGLQVFDSLTFNHLEVKL